MFELIIGKDIFYGLTYRFDSIELSLNEIQIKVCVCEPQISDIFDILYHFLQTFCLFSCMTIAHLIVTLRCATSIKVDRIEKQFVSYCDV